MQASLPSFVEAVKVDDFTIGKNALRIVSMRALPDQPTEPDYPKEEWIDQGDKSVRVEQQGKKGGEDGVDVSSHLPRSSSLGGCLRCGDTQLDQTGDYVNFEVSFAYFAPPGTKKLHNEVRSFFATHRSPLLTSLSRRTSRSSSPSSSARTTGFTCRFLSGSPSKVS